MAFAPLLPAPVAPVATSIPAALAVPASAPAPPTTPAFASMATPRAADLPLVLPRSIVTRASSALSTLAVTRMCVSAQEFVVQELGPERGV